MDIDVGKHLKNFQIQREATNTDGFEQFAIE